MVWPTKKPASGIPAKGAGKGDGWGGPARGAGRGGPARPYQPDNATRISFHTGQGDPVKVAKRRALTAEKEARIEHLIDQLGDLALNAQREETQVSACIAVLNRLEGTPAARSKAVATNKSLVELILATQAPKV